jgi:hypothetical protein
VIITSGTGPTSCWTRPSRQCRTVSPRSAELPASDQDDPTGERWPHAPLTVRHWAGRVLPGAWGVSVTPFRLPWSEWQSAQTASGLDVAAIVIAPTGRARMCSAIARPTSLRVHRSSTRGRDSHRWQVGKRGDVGDHRDRRNRRLTCGQQVHGAGGDFLCCLVKPRRLRRCTPTKSAPAMRAAGGRVRRPCRARPRVRRAPVANHARPWSTCESPELPRSVCHLKDRWPASQRGFFADGSNTYRTLERGVTLRVNSGSEGA